MFPIKGGGPSPTGRRCRRSLFPTEPWLRGPFLSDLPGEANVRGAPSKARVRPVSDRRTGFETWRWAWQRQVDRAVGGAPGWGHPQKSFCPEPSCTLFCVSGTRAVAHPGAWATWPRIQALQFRERHALSTFVQFGFLICKMVDVIWLSQRAMSVRRLVYAKRLCIWYSGRLRCP